MEYLKVEGHENLYRHLDSNAIVNKDFDTYQKYKMDRERKLQELNKVSDLENQVNELKNELSDIKNLLNQISSKLG